MAAAFRKPTVHGERLNENVMICVHGKDLPMCAVVEAGQVQLQGSGEMQGKPYFSQYTV